MRRRCGRQGIRTNCSRLHGSSTNFKRSKTASPVRCSGLSLNQLESRLLEVFTQFCYGKIQQGRFRCDASQTFWEALFTLNHSTTGLLQKNPINETVFCKRDPPNRRQTIIISGAWKMGACNVWAWKWGHSMFWTNHVPVRVLTHCFASWSDGHMKTTWFFCWPDRTEAFSFWRFRTRPFFLI